ncbi:MAG: hypothetical protein PHW21_00085 [Candidatus Izemoplasmatales bacterium]|nr:hypothetical protein [Candidatus Izemoplasmatales bacterium]
MKKKFLNLPKGTQNIIKYALIAITTISLIVFYSTSNKAELETINTIFSFIFVVSIIFLIVAYVWTKPKKLEEETKQDTLSKDYRDVFPVFFDSYILKWKYNIDLALPQNFSVIKPGNQDNLIFNEEPNNEYDEETIALYKDKSLLGYLYKGNIRDMVKKYFFKSKDYKPVMIINKVDEENKSIEVALAFYKYIDLDNSNKVKTIETKIYNNYDKEEYEERLDAQLDLEINDILIVEEDSYEGYVLLDSQYNELGKVNEKVEEEIDYFIEFKSGYITCKVKNIEEDDFGKPKVNISIYLIDKNF